MLKQAVNKQNSVLSVDMTFGTACKICNRLVTLDHQTSCKERALSMSDKDADKVDSAPHSEELAQEQDQFAEHIANELEQSENDIREVNQSSFSRSQEASLQLAKEKIGNFQPVPPFIWRIANYTFGRPGRINKLSDGNLFGLKKLVLNIGRDRVLGKGSSVTTTRSVLDMVPSDVIAATAVIHALGRRLQSREFQAVWGPILDDALMRAHIGYFVGTMCEDFGPGRGMLAGFSGRIGLALLIALGDAEQAQSSISLLAAGRNIEEVALDLYGCEPLHMAAMTLSASGCGRESVLGIASFTMSPKVKAGLSRGQRRWLAALTVTEKMRAGEGDAVDEAAWDLMGYDDHEERGELAEIVNTLKRRGHGWNWMV